jgi:hypothetical protein
VVLELPCRYLSVRSGVVAEPSFQEFAALVFGGVFVGGFGLLVDPGRARPTTILLMGAPTLATDRRGTDPLSTSDGDKAFRSLTRVEQFLFRRLITRQLVYGRNTERDIQKYGLEATIRLCSARAMGLYMVAIGVIGVVLAIAGRSAVAIPVFVFLWLLLIVFLSRCYSASRLGRHWRRSRTGV